MRVLESAFRGGKFLGGVIWGTWDFDGVMKSRESDFDMFSGNESGVNVIYNPIC